VSDDRYPLPVRVAIVVALALLAWVPVLLIYLAVVSL
jgi:hypothetical protein